MGKKIVPYNGPLSDGMRVVLRRIPGAPIRATVRGDLREEEYWYGKRNELDAFDVDGRKYKLSRKAGDGNGFWAARKGWYSRKEEAVEIEIIDNWANIVKKAF